MVLLRCRRDNVQPALFVHFDDRWSFANSKPRFIVSVVVRSGIPRACIVPAVGSSVVSTGTARHDR